MECLCGTAQTAELAGAHAYSLYRAIVYDHRLANFGNQKQERFRPWRESSGRRRQSHAPVCRLRLPDDIPDRAARRTQSMPACRVDGSGTKAPLAEDSAITEEPPPSLGRPQRRLLRRIYNGRTVPVIVDGQPFLTYKAASRYLLSLADDQREKAYLAMTGGAALGSGIEA